MLEQRFDALVIGAGVFGLHAATILGARGARVAVVDLDHRPVMRASFVNQARLHTGYHYPRSIYTALSASRHHSRFIRDFPSAVNSAFTKIYAVATAGSYTDAARFERFCQGADIPARSVDPNQWFNPGTVSAAFETKEFSFDAQRLRRQMIGRAVSTGNVTWVMGCHPTAVEIDADQWIVVLNNGSVVRAGRAVNATYAGLNAVLALFGAPPMPLKYELCEVCLGSTSSELRGVGITLMDGPFFSLMPFGHSGFHSLTSVEHTPRQISEDALPVFSCQADNADCLPGTLASCGSCPSRPFGSWPYMSQLVRKYLIQELEMTYRESLYTVKAVLRTSEVDDGRPTLIKTYSPGPKLTSVLSGKLTTFYDLEDAL